MTSRKILVVEDDADVRLGYRILLRTYGYATCFAADAASAVSVARKEQPDLILLDLGLPAGDGFMVLDRLANNTGLSHIPVAVVSARDRLGNESRALTSGASAYLQKPWDDEELIALIRRLLHEDDPSETAPAAGTT